MTLNVDGRGVGASLSAADFLFLGAGAVAFSFPFKLGWGGFGCVFFCGTGEPLTRPAETFGGSHLGFFATRSGALVAEACFGISGQEKKSVLFGNQVGAKHQALSYARQ